MVGSEQFAVLVVESETYQRLLKDTTIFVCQFLFFLLKQDLFRAVCHRTENVYGSDAGIGILCDALVFHIPPLTMFLSTADVPAEDTLVGLCLTSSQASDEIPVYFAVVRMYQLKTLFVAHTFVRQQISVQVEGVLTSDVEFQHVVLAHVKGVLHDGRCLLDLVHILTDTQYADTVYGPS